jgi:hypothetical protein
MMYLLYLDPGSGSYLIQVIIAAVLGVLFYFKSAWNWLKTIIYRKKLEKEEEEEKSENES